MKKVAGSNNKTEKELLKLKLWHLLDCEQHSVRTERHARGVGELQNHLQQLQVNTTKEPSWPQSQKQTRGDLAVYFHDRVTTDMLDISFVNPLSNSRTVT